MPNSKFKIVTGTAVGLLLMIQAVCGVIPEPDNVIYGSITLDNVPVTAARPDIVIEARRTVNGPAIASYRMGANPALGNFYSLRLSLESGTPVSNSNASQVGDAVYITLLDGTGLRAQTSFAIVERGVAQRVDFGVVVVDGDGDGLPDAWELLHFANLAQNTNSPGLNGQTAWQNYLAGTDPNDPASGFRLHLNTSNSVKQVSFVALRAEGAGYEGMTRLYTLESNPDLGSSWGEVGSVTDVPGDNQTVLYQTAGVNDSGFFRGRISLQPIATNDADSDGLPDNWETLYFSNLSHSASSPSLNQQTAIQNYIAGNNPNDINSVFKLSITRSNNQLRVWFVALRAEGTGYAGQNRYYSLETSSSPTAPNWLGVANLTNLLGNNQLVSLISPGTGTTFFRSRVWLQSQ